MVLCRFYLQGTCRFGAKCSNEHLDIKQLVKSDLEGAINGKQWPLSCFGPFKDKPCIPNFIEDQSFEEIRWLCYEAKQKNCVDHYVQQISKEAMEANSKMKTMVQLSPHVMDIICRLYDTPADGGNAGLPKNNINNPFGIGGGVLNETQSIFNKPGVASSGSNTFGEGFDSRVPTSNAGNVYGGMTTSPAGAIFGGGGSAFNFQNQQSSVFSHQLSKTNSVFGGGGSQNPLFNQAQVGTGVIGGLFGQTAQGTGSLFTQASQQHQQSSVNTGLFSQPQQQPQSVSIGGLFAQQCHTPAAPAGGNIFNQSIQQQLPPNGNIFTQSNPSQQLQTPSGYPLYQTNKQPTPSVFGQQNAFAQQNSSSMFGQMVPTTPANNTNSLFATPLNTTNANGNFKNPTATTMQTQNIFAEVLQQNKQNSANIFSQPGQTSETVSISMQPHSGYFQQSTQSPQLLHQPTSFGQQMGENSSTQTLLQSPLVSSSVYSKLDDLTTEDIEAFKADNFTPGKIPNVPPPRELIN